MQLNLGEGNGVIIAGRTSQNIARTARIVGNPTLCGDIVRSVLTAIITRAGSLPPAVASTDRELNKWESDV
jgi:hypothetical protein